MQLFGMTWVVSLLYDKMYRGSQSRMGRIEIAFTYDGDITFCRFKLD